MEFRGTTICAVKRGNVTAIAGDGQVTMGESVIFKNTAVKVRRIFGGKVILGFAGSVTDAFALTERFEGMLNKFGGNLMRSAVELAELWRSDKIGRKLDAMMITADENTLLILLRDIVKNRHSPTREEFAPFLDDNKVALIRQHFDRSATLPKPDDDINISVDQTKSLRQAIARGLKYPEMEGNSFNYEDLVAFLGVLRRIFKWDIYERKTLGHISSKDGTFANLRYYATVLSRWMEGKGLRTIIDAAI